MSREGICSHENRTIPSSGLAVATGRSFSDGNGRVFTEKYNFQDISGHLMMTLSMTIWRVMSTTTRNSQQGGIIFNFKDKTELGKGYNNSFD